MVRSDYPFCQDSNVMYFEITIKESKEEGTISLGISREKFLLNQHVGWAKESVGYHSDGSIYNESDKVDYEVEPFTKGDVVGCGIDVRSEKIFFTKNGKKIYNEDVALMSYYPTFGVHDISDIVKANFGQESFVFDVDKMLEVSNEKRWEEIDEYDIPSPLPLIKNHLLYYAYKDSFDVFQRMTNLSLSNHFEELLFESLDDRNKLRQMVMSGNSLECIEEVKKTYPTLFMSNETILFKLNAQHFIELIKRKMVSEAITFGREVFRKPLPEDHASYFQQCCALLCYPDLEKCPLSNLVSAEHTESIADELNFSILEYTIKDKEKKFAKQSNLESLLIHLENLRAEMKLLNGGIGSNFSVQKYVQDPKNI